jgi:hypothetical protein
MAISNSLGSVSAVLSTFPTWPRIPLCASNNQVASSRRLKPRSVEVRRTYGPLEP